MSEFGLLPILIAQIGRLLRSPRDKVNFKRVCHAIYSALNKDKFCSWELRNLQYDFSIYRAFLIAAESGQLNMMQWYYENYNVDYHTAIEAFNLAVSSPGLYENRLTVLKWLHAQFKIRPIEITHNEYASIRYLFNSKYLGEKEIMTIIVWMMSVAKATMEDLLPFRIPRVIALFRSHSRVFTDEALKEWRDKGWI